MQGPPKDRARRRPRESPSNRPAASRPVGSCLAVLRWTSLRLWLQRFRHDLLARLNGVTLHLPPLRERPEDIPLPIALLLRKLAPDRGDVSFTPDATEALLEHSWPLNVRELEQALAGALALSEAGPIDAGHLPPAVTGRQPPEKRELTPEEIKHRDELVQHLREQGGNVNAVARVLGKHRTQVVRWLARYEIDARAVTDES